MLRITERPVERKLNEPNLKLLTYYHYYHILEKGRPKSLESTDCLNHSYIMKGVFSYLSNSILCLFSLKKSFLTSWMFS